MLKGRFLMSVRDPVMPSRSLRVQGEFLARAGGTGSLRGEFRLQRIERTATHHVRAVGSVGGSLCDEAGQLICVARRRVVVPWHQISLQAWGRL
jgi:hypothetical protein